MVTISRDVATSATGVWDILADGWTYASWVVGAAHIREVDPAWPAVGSRLHHSVGTWPLMLHDFTEVRAAEPARSLVLRARAWPMGEAQVTVTLAPVGADSCRVTMEEHPVRGPGAWLHNPASEALLRARNVETLRRLDSLAVGHRPDPDGSGRPVGQEA